MSLFLAPMVSEAPKVAVWISIICRIYFIVTSLHSLSLLWTLSGTAKLKVNLASKIWKVCEGLILFIVLRVGKSSLENLTQSIVVACTQITPQSFLRYTQILYIFSALASWTQKVLKGFILLRWLLVFLFFLYLVKSLIFVLCVSVFYSQGLLLLNTYFYWYE